MNKCYLGIDIGKKGFMCWQHDDGIGYFSFLENDLKDMFLKLKELKSKFGKNMVAMFEDVHAIYGSSAKSTFSFGLQKGYVIASLSALDISYIAVKPALWQKEIWTPADMVYTYKQVDDKVIKRVDTKATSFNAGKRLFPENDFRRTKACKNVDDNKVDATLLSEFARRKNY